MTQEETEADTSGHVPETGLVIEKFQRDDPLALQIHQLLRMRLGDLPDQTRARLDQFVESGGQVDSWYDLCDIVLALCATSFSHAKALETLTNTMKKTGSNTLKDNFDRLVGVYQMDLHYNQSFEEVDQFIRENIERLIPQIADYPEENRADMKIRIGMDLRSLLLHGPWGHIATLAGHSRVVSELESGGLALKESIHVGEEPIQFTVTNVENMPLEQIKSLQEKVRGIALANRAAGLVETLANHPIPQVYDHEYLRGFQGTLASLLSPLLGGVEVENLDEASVLQLIEGVVQDKLDVIPARNCLSDQFPEHEINMGYMPFDLDLLIQAALTTGMTMDEAIKCFKNPYPRGVIMGSNVGNGRGGGK